MFIKERKEEEEREMKEIRVCSDNANEIYMLQMSMALLLRNRKSYPSRGTIK